eukprot:gene10801-14500_t
MIVGKVRRDFILPATAGSRCRYVELPKMAASGVVGPANPYISHAWSGYWGDLVAAVLDGNTDANNIDTKAIIALDAASLMLPQIRIQIAFLRVWCLTEIYYASACVPNMRIIMKNGGAYSKINSVIKFTSSNEILLRESSSTILRMWKGALNRLVDQLVRAAVFSSHASSIYSSDFLPIFQCALLGNDTAREMLLSIGLDVDILDSESGMTPPIDACKKTNKNITCLMLAAFGSNFTSMKILIENGADVNLKDCNGISTLLALISMMAGDGDKHAEILIERGANVNHTANKSFTPLLFASCATLPWKGILNLLSFCLGIIMELADKKKKDSDGKTCGYLEIADILATRCTSK